MNSTSHRRSVEKEVRNSTTLTRNDPPEPTASPRCSFFRCKRMSDRGSKLSVTSAKSRSSSSSSDSTSRQPSLPHTITERHGGQELWVKAPVVSGSLEKRGFRWRKKWKLRFLELDGRQLVYYEDSGGFSATTATTSGTRKNRKAKKKVMLTADAKLEEVDETTISIIPALNEQPWLLRAKDAATKQRWLIALSDCIDIVVWLQHYKLGEVVGVGGNGVVQKLEDERDGTIYAMKILDVAKFRHREQVVAEVDIMRNITNNIKHPNLVKIHKVYEEQRKVYIIQEMCNGGELYDRVVQRGKYSETDAANIMHQLVSALHALHSHNILHLDIKPENILFASKDPDSKILLTDFGLARMINGKQNPLDQGQSMAGTIGYMAPEVISSHAYSEAADVFSAGVILFILLVGYPPFYGDSEVEILLKVARGDFTFDPHDWRHITESVKELVARMLEVHAQNRITLDEVLAHPWITRSGVGSGDNDIKERDLTSSMMTRLQRFNIDRKSKNMGTMALMLLDVDEADFHALMDEKAIQVMLQKLSVEGHDRLPLEKASVIFKGLGLSPYIDEVLFVQFLDRDHDGYINACDFCEGIRALRNYDPSFAAMVFSAIQKIYSLEDKSAEREQINETAVLTRDHFRVAFSKLNCPGPLIEVFFKHVDEQHHVEASDNLTTSWSVNEAEFATLFSNFSFLGMLFLRTCHASVMSMVKSNSGPAMQRTSEVSVTQP